MTWVIPATAKMGLGVRAGFSRSWMIQKVDLDYRSGSHFGYSVAALADVSFYQRFSFRPEIVLTNQGGSYESPVQDDKGKYSASHYSLQIPLNIAYNIPISGVRMAVYAGPAADIHLRGKMKSKRMGEELFPASEKEMKPFDLGVNSGISVEYRNVFFSVNVLCGTLDRRIDKVNEESKVYQNNLTFSLGYIFR
jgi:hypothetical protein